MTHVNLQAAQSSDITRILKRDFPAEFRRANRISNIHGFFAVLLVPMPLAITATVAVAVSAGYLGLITGTLWSTWIVLGVPVFFVAMTHLLFIPYTRTLGRLSAIAEDRYGVRLCMVGDGKVVVEGGSLALEDRSTDMHETRAFLAAQEGLQHA